MLLAVIGGGTDAGGFQRVPENADVQVESSLQLIAAQVEAQVIALRMEFYLFLGALIVFGLYSVLFVYVVSDWRRDQRDRLLAKLLLSVSTANREASGKRDEN